MGAFSRVTRQAGKAKAVNHHNDVPFRVLDRKRGFCSHAEAWTLAQL